MRVILLTILIFTITSCATHGNSEELMRSSSSLKEGPKIEFEYAGVFDSVCSKKANINLTPELVQKANESTPRFQNYWDKSSGPLFKELFKTVGRSFYRKELTVYTTICDYIPMSQPFLLNVRFWIEKDDQIIENSVVQMTFHEFIHKYLVSVAKFQSLSLVHGRFKNESPGVKSHIHLMAIEKTVYEAAGRSDLVGTAGYVYTKLIKGDYKRAWEIVSKEGSDMFVEDVRAALR